MLKGLDLLETILGKNLFYKEVEELRTAQKEILQEMRKVLEKLTAIM